MIRMCVDEVLSGRGFIDFSQLDTDACVTVISHETPPSLDG